MVTDTIIRSRLAGEQNNIVSDTISFYKSEVEQHDQFISEMKDRGVDLSNVHEGSIG